MIKILWFKKKQEQRAEPESENKSGLDSLLSAFVGTTAITAKEALEIPAVSACVELISNTVAIIPIKLYKEVAGEVEEITDNRVFLLNDETGDLLNSFQMRKAWVTDYLLNGAGYIYINKELNSVKSLHYVEKSKISVVQNSDPIFKMVDIYINGQVYKDFELLKITKNTVNGVQGRGIIESNQSLLAVSYNTLKMEERLVKKGGNKNGFLKTPKKLSDDAKKELKNAWTRLYSNNNDDSMVLLQDGLDFQEASNTLVEMQLNENKRTNDEQIYNLFNVPVEILKGSANDEQKNNFIQNCIMPILKAIEATLNKDLLLEEEKRSLFYFAFDTKELLKGDIEKRFNAYKTAIETNIMQIDEVRYELDLKPLGFNFIKLGLQDVLLNPKTGEVYTPNTNASVNLNTPKQKEGEKVED